MAGEEWTPDLLRALLMASLSAVGFIILGLAVLLWVRRRRGAYIRSSTREEDLDAARQTSLDAMTSRRRRERYRRKSDRNERELPWWRPDRRSGRDRREDA